jgi:hypothetical protein
MSFVDAVRGKIFLAVQDHGELWYVKPLTLKRTYVGGATHVMELMKQGVGISNADIEKIPIGVLADVDHDMDRDGLPNDLESVLGTSVYSTDSDNDGVHDATEVQNHTNARGAGSLTIDGKLASQLAGKIILQVETRGAAWYVHPTTHQRFFLGRPEDGFKVFAQLATGISTENLNRIAQDHLSP